jgi:hypothetical protein
VLAEFSVIWLSVLAEFSVIWLSLLATQLEPFFLLRVVNPSNPVNLANLIYQSICAAVWAKPGNLANPANPTNPICLLVRVAVLANPVNPVMVTQIFSLVRDLSSNTCHPQVAWPDHLVSLG